MGDVFDRIKAQVNSPAQSYDNAMENTDQMSMADRIARQRSVESSTAFQLPGFQKEKYTSYLGETFNPLSDIDEQRAQSQSTGQLIGGFFGQLATEALVGMPEAAGYAFDFEELNDLATGGNKQAQEGFDNAFSRYFREAKNYIQDEYFPVYQTQAAQEGSFWERLSDPTFRASQGKTIGTTLSLMAPAALVGIGAGALTANPIIGAMAAAMFSRKAESAMESQQVFEQEYNKYIQEGKSDIEARELAGQISADVFKANAMMLPLDMLQFGMAMKAFKPIADIAKTAKATKFGRIAEQAIFQPLSEAAEEGYQFIAQQEAIKGIKEGFTPFGDGLGNRIGDYMSDPEFQTSAFMGAVTGGIFGTVVPAVTDVAKKKITEYGAMKTISGNYGDAESFSKVDAKIERDTLIKAIKANKIDQYKATMAATVADMKSSGNFKEEDIAEAEVKFKEFSDNADYVKNAEAKLIESRPEYAKNPEVRAAYAMLKYSDKKTVEELAKVDSNISKLESQMTDPRDRYVVLRSQISALNVIKERLSRDSSLSEEEKAKKLAEVTEQINEKKSELNLVADNLKTNPQYKGYNPKEYSNPNIEEYTLESIKKFSLELAKNKYRAELAKYENKSDVEIRKEEAEIKATAAKKIVDTQVKVTNKELEGATDVKSTKEILTKHKGQVTEAGVVSAHEELKKNEAVDYSTDNLNSPTKIYKVGTEETAKHNFIDDQIELTKELEKTLKDIDPQNLPTEISSLTTTDDIEEFEIALNNIKTFSTTPNLETAGLYKRIDDVITNFYNKRAIEHNTKFKLPDGEQIIPEYTYESAYDDVQDPLEGELTPKKPRGQFDATLKEVEKKNIFNKAGELIGKGYRTLEHVIRRGVVWKELNDYREFPVDTEVEYEVDMNSKAAPGKVFNGQETTWRNFAIETTAKNRADKKRVIGILPAVTDEMIDSPEHTDLIELRKIVWDKVQGKSGVISTGIRTKIAVSHAGRFRSSFNKFYSPVEVVGNTGVPVKLGIVIEVAGVRQIKGLSEADMGIARLDFLKDAQLGAVYQFLPAANGELIPARTFTKKLRDTPKGTLKLDVFNKLMSIFEKDTNLGNISKDINEIAYLVFDKPDYKANNNQGELTLYKDKKPYVFNITKLKSKDKEELKKLDDFLGDLVLQIKSKKLGTGVQVGDKVIPYERAISDRLKINLEPNNWIHGARYTMSDVWTDSGKVVVNTKNKKATEVITPEVGEEVETFTNTPKEAFKLPPNKKVAQEEINEALNKSNINLENSAEIDIFAELTKEPLRELTNYFSQENTEEGEKISTHCKAL